MHSVSRFTRGNWIGISLPTNLINFFKKATGYSPDFSSGNCLNITLVTAAVGYVRIITLDGWDCPS
jgi:hypothetical protein